MKIMNAARRNVPSVAPQRRNRGMRRRTGGGGLMYPLGPGDLILEAHFQLGLTVIQKDIETSGKSRTGAVVISLGYSFPLSGKK